ncbi:hypothetical protein COV18_04465 [Candidatus Woesearchaeota archaeon CG10_big_fil_rev_8_21_14_0_10_37_12]|nr:MAG: hypothetical protein COV18_04465 [Candidatus Woesearchaeota archaeon CG10_big_fil_rev_8_21_14_0_10_37_12]
MQINPAYSTVLLKQARQHFKKTGVVQLMSFLEDANLNPIWKHKCDPLKYSCRESKCKLSKEFKETIKLLTGKLVKSSKLLMFKKGDYTVLYDGMKQPNVVLFLDFVDMKESWGGYTAFIKNSAEVFRIVPKANTLTLVDCSKISFFTKYVNHHAKNTRIVLCAELDK